MSANNGIYILEMKDGFRVAHAQAIENIYWNAALRTRTDQINNEILYDYFYESDVYKDSADALDRAITIYKEIINDGLFGIEYGISAIQGLEDKEFPTKGTE